MKTEPGLEMSLQPLWKSSNQVLQICMGVEGKGEWKLSESWLMTGYHSSVHNFITCPTTSYTLRRLEATVDIPSVSRALLLSRKAKQLSVSAVIPAHGQIQCSLASHMSISLVPALLHLYRIKKWSVPFHFTGVCVLARYSVCMPNKTAW